MFVFYFIYCLCLYFIVYVCLFFSQTGIYLGIGPGISTSYARDGQMLLGIVFFVLSFVVFKKIVSEKIVV